MRLVDKDALKERCVTYINGARYVAEWRIEDEPEINAVDKTMIRRMLEREYARLYRCEEKLSEQAASHNESSFLAGYKYALDCVTGNLASLDTVEAVPAVDEATVKELFSLREIILEADRIMFSGVKMLSGLIEKLEGERKTDA